MKKYLLVIFICFLSLSSRAQGSILEAYIAEGLKNNLALQQKNANHSISLEKLRQARAMFFPDLSLNARYSVANGGRLIEFPVGTLLNPVYSSLNYLLGSESFPDIENMDFAFYRPTEHETKIHLLQPIADTKIYYNRKIQQDLSEASRSDADSYKRQLVCDIKTAYFNYLKSIQLLHLVDDTRKLLMENIRVNESLYQNQKVTVDNLYRSRAELSRLEQQAALASKNNGVAKFYLNFLLNRPLESMVEIDEHFTILPESPSIEIAMGQAFEKREELKMLECFRNASDHNLSMYQMNSLPGLYAAVDYGFQGRDYEFNERQDYLFASLVLSWDIFHGFENRSKISQARIENELRQSRLEETRNMISLQVREAWLSLEASHRSVIAAEEEMESAKKAFSFMERKYAGDQASLVEFIDARTTMTNAEQQLIISRYDYFISHAELERIAGLYPLGEKNDDLK